MARLLRSYGLMFKWQALSNKPLLPINLIVQLMIAVGFIIGIGFFYPEISPDTAKYLTTGAPTISLLMVGLVLVPQIVALARTQGTFDYIWSLPAHSFVERAQRTFRGLVHQTRTHFVQRILSLEPIADRVMQRRRRARRELCTSQPMQPSGYWFRSPVSFSPWCSGRYTMTLVFI